jgi:hypothetical protein
MLFVLTTATQILTGCFYRKVHLTRTEKELIPYWTRKSYSIFKNENILDTVHFYKSGYKYEPNFDHWWSKKISGDTSANRGLYYSVIASSNFPHNLYSDKHLHLIQLRISFTKKSDKDTLRLSIEDFSQTYDLNETTSDTLIFQRPESRPCHICVTKILWTTDRGIVQIKKNDGTVWSILTRDNEK